MLIFTFSFLIFQIRIDDHVYMYRLLIRLVDQFGIRKWSHIAQMLPGRIGKQCRERWHNHLRPDIKVN